MPARSKLNFYCSSYYNSRFALWPWRGWWLRQIQTCKSISQRTCDEPVNYCLRRESTFQFPGFERLLSEHSSGNEMPYLFRYGLLILCHNIHFFPHDGLNLGPLFVGKHAHLIYQD